MVNVVILGTFWLLLAACSQPSSDGNVPFDESSIDGVWHQAKLRGVAFRAIGQEPGWLLEISNGVEILLVTNYGKSRERYPYVEPVVYQEQRRTQYIIDREKLVIEIRGVQCTDTMSGEEFEVTVTVDLGDTLLRGCGRALF